MDKPPADRRAAVQTSVVPSHKEADEAAGLAGTEIEDPFGAGCSQSTKSLLLEARTELILREAGVIADLRTDDVREIDLNASRRGGGAEASQDCQPGAPAAHSNVSRWGTFLVLAKSTVGGGGTLMVLPAGFHEAGCIPASIELAAICAVEVYCMVLLTRCVRKLGRASFGDVAMSALGAPLSIAVDISLLLSQLGFVCAEMLFFAKSLVQPLQNIGVPHVPPVKACILLQLVLVVPMAWIRRLKYFALPNMIANVTVLSTLVVLAAVSLTGLAQGKVGPDVQVVGETKGVMRFAGTSVFAFACINFVIPIFEEHRDKDKFEPVLVGTLSGACCVFILFGAINYVRYGADTKDILSLNLPAGSALGDIVPLAFALASLLNVPLTLFPAATLIERRLLKSRPSGKTWGRICLKNVMRAALALVCALVALFGADHIMAMVALIGSVCCVPLAFIYPAICHLKLCKPGLIGTAIDLAIGVGGLFPLVLTTYQAILELRQQTNEGHAATSVAIEM